MAGKKRVVLGRPVGAGDQITDIAGCPFVYGKPIFMHGRWRVRQRHRETGAVSLITLPDAEDLGHAITDTHARAEKEKAAAEEAALPPEKRLTPTITLEAAWKEFLEYVKDYRGVRTATLEAYEWDRDLYVRHFGETKIVDTLTKKDIEDFVARQGSARSKQKHQSAWKRFLKWCQSHRYVRENVAADLEIPPSWRKEITEAVYETGTAITAEDAIKLLSASRDKFTVGYKRAGTKFTEERTPPSDLYVAIAIPLLSGLRKRNVVGDGALRWGDLDLTEGQETITIDAARMKGGREFFAPLNGQLAQLLRERRKAGRRIPSVEEAVVGGVRDFDAAFVGAVKRSGLKKKYGNVRYHDLRHTFGGFLESAPQGIFTHLMDHSKARRISDRYRHPDFEEMRKHLNAIPAILVPPAPEAKTATG